MADHNSADETASGTAAPTQPGSRVSHEEALASRLPSQEANQPDPVLQLSVGRLGAGPIALLGVICAVILAVVLYGLNSPAPNTQDVGTPPSAASNPAAGGKGGPARPATSTPQQTNNSGHS